MINPLKATKSNLAINTSVFKIWLYKCPFILFAIITSLIRVYTHLHTYYFNTKQSALIFHLSPTKTMTHNGL